MDTPHVPPAPGAVDHHAVLDNLRAAQTHLRTLSEQPSADPFYAQVVKQIEAIVAGLESREATAGPPPVSPEDFIGLPSPPNPGLLPDPPNPGLLPDPPNPGLLPDPPNPGLLPVPPSPGLLPVPPNPGLLPDPPSSR